VTYQRISPLTGWPTARLALTVTFSQHASSTALEVHDTVFPSRSARKYVFPAPSYAFGGSMVVVVVLRVLEVGGKGEGGFQIKVIT
jgi:hypothetical protein